jgi:hypothetical protein
MSKLHSHVIIFFNHIPLVIVMTSLSLHDYMTIIVITKLHHGFHCVHAFVTMQQTHLNVNRALHHIIKGYPRST